MSLHSIATIGQDEISTRVCIIGAGAAGITLACELAGSGLDVLLLESGGLQVNPALAADYDGRATAPHPPPDQFRRSVFGGTTGLWGGRCIPFDPIDLEVREGLRGGWPISYDELARYYPRALEYCEAGRFDFSAASAIPGAAATIAGFDGRGLMLPDQIERYSLPTDFGRSHRRIIQDAANVRALTGARVTRLLKADGEDRIAAVETLDDAGRRRLVRAEAFVLATGGIEAPRLLMHSDPTGQGYGNLGESLGRYYMCHFETTCARIVPHGARVVFNFERSSDGIYCRRQMRFRADALRQHGLLNIAFRLHFPSYSDATHGSAVMSTIYMAKSVLVPEYRAILQHSAQAEASPNAEHVRNILTGLPQLARFGYDWLFKIKFARRKLPYTLVPNADGSFPVEFNSEQLPLASNRITLLPDRDRHGIPKVQVNWRLSEQDTESAYRAFGLLRSSLNGSGTCQMDYDEPQLRKRITGAPPLGGHHIGTTRMGASERDGVVDRNCAVFGLPNLYVASSSVFPTSSHANPTLTIVALTVRLGEHLRKSLAPASVA